MGSKDKSFDKHGKPIPPKKPSKLALLMGVILRWATAVMAIFTLGIVLMWVLQVRPKTNEIRELQAELDEATERLDELEEVDAENTSLQTAFEDAQLHLILVNILVDVNTAQLALLEENIDTAQSALVETEDKLSELEAGLDNSQQNTVESLQDRLTQVHRDLTNRDVSDAQSNLDILRSSLLALERSLFGN
ncbi:MAG: hypothetical protein FVQ83_04465 [Chloroflexi bacterium]|nr:hypothetical protein [Chloroflexota bacterium]